MKIITCASFYGSGSSAITDLISEYESVCSMTEYEFRFLQDPDGISDLEYHLVENHNRHNSGHALKRFKRLSKFNAGIFFDKRYEKFFKGHYRRYTQEYIENLTDFTFNGHWFYDLYDKGTFYYYMKQIENKILRKLTNGRRHILENEITYCSYPSEGQFLLYTKEYLRKLFSVVNKKNSEYLMIDQLVPSTNIRRYLRYFDDLFVVVVDRDPRDIFTLEKYYWKTGVIPTEDVDKFCDWFLYTRAGSERGEIKSNQILYIQFEDLVYRYDKTIRIVQDFLGLDCYQHKNQFEKFNPKQSVKNTQVWKKMNIQNEIETIEQRLDKFLYDYSKYEISQIVGKKEVQDIIF